MTLSSRWFSVVCCVLAACLEPLAAPGERPTDDATTAGTSVVASWPAHGTSGVPVNLAYAAIGFNGALETHPDHVAFESVDRSDVVPATVEWIECATLGLPAHTCVQLLPERPLLPITAYTLRVDSGWIDASRSSVDPWFATFTTSAAIDLNPPRPIAIPCALDETLLAAGCALITDRELVLRVATDEPAVVTLQLAGCGPIASAALGAETTFTLRDLAPDRNHQLHFELVDAADNHWTIDETITTAPTLPAITISEVRADPVGPEPQQEYVELFNAGRDPIDLTGYSITDDAFDEGDVIARNVIVHPGGYVLLVADDFDAASTLDIRPAPGAMLVRVGTSIANAGLSNSGEPLYLRDASGTRLSTVPRQPSSGDGVCLQRRDLHARDGTDGAFVHDAARPCTPGL